MVRDEFDLDYKNKTSNDNYNDFEDFGDNYERKPQTDGYDTYQLRTDPTPLLKKVELTLRSRYVKKHKDGKTTEEQIEGTVPLCNEQGIQEILRMCGSFINNHTVQGNQANIQEHRLRMREIADSLTNFFFSQYTNWELSLHKVNNLIDQIYFLIDLFLTRTLENKERELYGETYKETTNRDVRTDKGRGGFLSGVTNKLLTR